MNANELAELEKRVHAITKKKKRTNEPPKPGAALESLLPG